MPTETVTLVLDKSQYERAISEVVAGQGRLSRSGADIGSGFIRGERVVRTASANIASSLLASGDAATTALVAMQGLERVFRIGLFPTIAVAGGIALFEVFHRQIQRTRDASEELAKELAKSFGLQAQSSVESLTSDIDKLTETVKKLRKEVQGPTSTVMDIIGTIGSREAMKDVNKAFGKSPLAPLPPSKEEQRLLDSETRLRELVSARADKEVKIAEAKRDQNKIGQLELEYESKRANLFQGAYKSGLNMVDLMKRLIALQIVLNSEVANEVQRRHDAVAAAAGKFKKSTGDLFKDIGSGQFLKDLGERNRENLQKKSGIDMAKEFSDFQEKGGTIGPNAQAMVDASKQALAKGGLGLEDIGDLDFSNLDLLSKYDFSGLEPLNHLTIKIQ